MSADTRAAGASILLAVDGLFLGALLFIHVSSRNGYLTRMRELGVAAPGWPDVGGGPGAALPWAAAGAVALAAALSKFRAPLAPLLLVAAAIGLTVLSLDRMAKTGAVFGSGRLYGTLATILAVCWIAHLVGAIVALGRGKHAGRFLALQAAFGIGLATVVFPG